MSDTTPEVLDHAVSTAPCCSTDDRLYDNAGLSRGQVVLVRGWWRKGLPAVEAEIVSVWKTSSKFIDVRPMQGNPHMRSLDLTECETWFIR